MSKEDLIPLTKRPPEEAREIRARGGRSKSQLKSIAAKLRELKKKGLTDENAKHISNMLDSPEYTSLDVLMTLQKMKSKANTVQELNMFTNAMMNWQKINHGSADSTKIQINTQNNYYLTDEQKKEVAERLLGKKE